MLCAYYPVCGFLPCLYAIILEKDPDVASNSVGNLEARIIAAIEKVNAPWPD